MCRSDHYSGQSPNTKESCSSTPLNRCTSTETCWNKKAVSRSSPEWWLIFLARSDKKSEADSLIGPRVSTAIGWKMYSAARIFVFFLSCRQLGYWSSFSGSRGNIRVDIIIIIIKFTCSFSMCRGRLVVINGQAAINRPICVCGGGGCTEV